MDMQSQHSTAQHGTTQHGTAQHSAAQQQPACIWRVMLWPSRSGWPEMVTGCQLPGLLYCASLMTEAVTVTAISSRPLCRSSSRT